MPSLPSIRKYQISLYLTHVLGCGCCTAVVLGSVVEKHCKFVKAGLYHFDLRYCAPEKPINLNGYVGSKVDTDIPS